MVIPKVTSSLLSPPRDSISSVSSGILCVHGSVCECVCLSVCLCQEYKVSNFDTAIIIYGGFSCKVKVGVSQLNYYQYKEMCYTHKQTDSLWHVVMWDKL